MVKKPTNTVNEPAITQETEDVCTAFATELLVTAAILHTRQGARGGKRAGHIVKSFRKHRSNVSRQTIRRGWTRRVASKIPADFKRHIDEKYGAGVLHHESRRQSGRDLSGGRVAARSRTSLPSSRLQSIEEKFLNKVNYYGQMVEMDAQGRLLMPQICAKRPGSGATWQPRHT